MKYKNITFTLFVSLILLFILSPITFAQETVKSNPQSMLEVQQYERSIHIMAMLVVGFGFLMVFVKKYGRSALTATFLLVSIALPFYFLISNLEILGIKRPEIETLILSEFGAASLLIAAGAMLGRLKMYQYIILGLLFIPFYKINEWIVVENGLKIMSTGIADTGGSIVIHAFGAIFGVSAAFAFRKKSELSVPIESDATSDRFSMVGSMVLWLFWPSFCAALVPVEAIPYTVVNVFLALCGSTLLTYFLSVKIRGKINIADIANAALAGGVAIGSTCDHASHVAAFIVGGIAGIISTGGFAILQARQQKALNTIDTCGVSNLHGLPGLFGGLAAIPLIGGLNIGNQLIGILLTIGIALTSGMITGKVFALSGRRKNIYDDYDEFEGEPEEAKLRSVLEPEYSKN
jgi:ammonium transporter Rh